MQNKSFLFMKRLSVIIPMYNVEPYVERCIQSLEDQDILMTDYEIICINDGSPDNSREVVLKMQQIYENIILIDQENQGVSCARNKGIDRSSGKYLLFIDPDDYVESNCFKRVLQCADNNNSQITFLGFTFLKTDGSVHKQVFYRDFSNQMFSGIDAYFIARGDGYTDPDRMVAILFNTSFMNLNGFRYLPNVPYLEDGELLSRILCMAERCFFEENSFYLRTTRLGSATNSNLNFSEKAAKGFLFGAINLKKFQQRQNLSKDQRVFLNQPIVKFVALYINANTRLLSFRKLLLAFKTLKENGLQYLETEKCNKLYTTIGRHYNRSAVWLYMYMIIHHLHTCLKRLKS